MPYTIEVRTDPPVAVVTFESPIDFEKDVVAIVQWVADHHHEVVDVIHDLTRIQPTFSSVVQAAGSAFKPRPDRQMPDLDVVLVGVTGFFRSIAGWLAQPQYSNRRVRLYDTLEEALDASRERAKAA